MERRDFLIASTMAVGAASRAFAQATPTAAKLDRIAIMTYSFQRLLKAPGQPESPTRTLEFFDMSQMFADRFKVHNLEVQHSHFASTELSYLKEFMARLAKTKSRVSNINLELGQLSISSPDPVARTQAVDLTKRWIDHAIVLGSPRVMINQGALTEDNKAIAIETLKRMTAYAKTKNIMVGMEPRGNGARRGAPPPTVPAYQTLTDVAVGGGGNTNPDVGNFGGDQAFQHAGMRVMFPHTDGNCHIKMLTPSQYDLSAAIKLTKELGYKGLYSIEFEGAGDNYEGVQAVYDALLANL